MKTNVYFYNKKKTVFIDIFLQKKVIFFKKFLPRKALILLPKTLL